MNRPPHHILWSRHPKPLACHSGEALPTPHPYKPPPPCRQAHQGQQVAPNHQEGGTLLVNTRSHCNQQYRVRCRAAGLQVHCVAHQLTRRCLPAAMKSPLLLKQLSPPPLAPQPSAHPTDTEPKSERPDGAATDHLERPAYSAAVDFGKNGRAEIERPW